MSASPSSGDPSREKSNCDRLTQSPSAKHRSSPQRCSRQSAPGSPSAVLLVSRRVDRQLGLHGVEELRRAPASPAPIFPCSSGKSKEISAMVGIDPAGFRQPPDDQRSWARRRRTRVSARTPPRSNRDRRAPPGTPTRRSSVRTSELGRPQPASWPAIASPSLKHGEPAKRVPERLEAGARILLAGDREAAVGRSLLRRHDLAARLDLQRRDVLFEDGVRGKLARQSDDSRRRGARRACGTSA